MMRENADDDADVMGQGPDHDADDDARHPG